MLGGGGSTKWQLVICLSATEYVYHDPVNNFYVCVSCDVYLADCRAAQPQPFEISLKVACQRKGG